MTMGGGRDGEVYVECRVEPPPSTSVGGVQVPDVWRVAGVHIMGGGSAEHGTLSTAAGAALELLLVFS